MAKKHTISDLHQMQSLPLSMKIEMTKRRIEEWVNEFGEEGVYISFSGGKDSTVLLDIARKIYPNIKALFVDIPTQYPELKQFVMKFNNVDIVKPDKNFFEVCEEYGFPFISKEVSNNACGARKYIKYLDERNSLKAQSSRQTDRQTEDYPTEISYSYNFRRIKGIGEYDKQRFRECGRKSAKARDISRNEGKERRKNISTKGAYP